MKKIILLTAIALTLLCTSSFADEKLRIGVYDSRMLAIWHFNSDEYRKEMKEFMNSYQKAKESKDTVKIREFEERGPLTQRILHDKGFGRGTMANVIEKRQDELEALAESEKLIAVVSKWELNYSSPEIEIVDVTLKLMELLKAPENLTKMYEQMKSQAPVEDAFFLDPRK